MSRHCPWPGCTRDADRVIVLQDEGDAEWSAVITCREHFDSQLSHLVFTSEWIDTKSKATVKTLPIRWLYPND